MPQRLPFSTSIRRQSGWALAATLLGMLLMGALTLFILGVTLFDPEWADELLRDEFLEPGAMATINGPVRWSVTALMVLPVLVELWALNQARGLFLIYREGAIFTVAAAARLRKIGIALILLAIASILSESLSIVLLTVLNPPEQRAAGFSLSDGDILALVFGLLLVTVGRILEEAARISDEVDSFV